MRNGPKAWRPPVLQGRREGVSVLLIEQGRLENLKLQDIDDNSTQKHNELHKTCGVAVNPPTACEGRLQGHGPRIGPNVQGEASVNDLQVAAAVEPGGAGGPLEGGEGPSRLPSPEMALRNPELSKIHRVHR